MNSNTNRRRAHGPTDYAPLFAGMGKRGLRYRPTTEPQPPTPDNGETDTEEYRPAYWWQRD